MSARPIAALFCREDSIYKQIHGVDVWDQGRDAMKWPGGCPVIAHPPCRLWATLRKWSKADPSEKKLGLWAVEQVRNWGGGSGASGTFHIVAGG